MADRVGWRLKLSSGALGEAMAKELTALVDTQISVITNDGRNIIGILRGFDQTTNLILEDCFERVYSANSGVEQAVLGLYIIRGDNIAVIGPSSTRSSTRA